MIGRIAAIIAALAAVPGSAAADPLVVEGDRLYLSVHVNGKPVEALLDSAAELSVADLAAAPALGLGAGSEVTARGSGGTQEARIVPDVEIAALGITITDTPVAVIDLSEVGARLLGRRIDFILGHDFFAATRLSIDIENGSIQAITPGENPEGTELLITEHAGISAVPVVAAGKQVRADFDLGNGSDVLISKALANELRLKPAGLEPAGGIGGAKLREVVFLPRLTIAGRTFTQVRCNVDPEPNAGDLNIGVKLLRHFLIATDFAAGKVWLSPR